MSEDIEVHVFGGKRGESIAIRLPGEQWGVIDSYAKRRTEPNSNATARFLSDRGISKIRFLCLTHPHADHYRGINQLIEAFDPDDIWIFGATTHRDLHERVAIILKSQAESSNLPDGGSATEEVGELVEFLDRVRDRFRDHGRNPQLRVIRLQLEQPLLKLPADPPVVMTALAADGRSVLLYEESLTKCFSAQQGFLADKVPSVNHNLIAGGVLLEYGQARLIFGSDMEVEAWGEAVKVFEPAGRLQSCLVKVSHHGSENGFCDGLWLRMSPNKSAIAVLTPYVSQGLPSPKGLTEVQRHAKRTFSASLSAASLSNDWKAERTAFADLSVDALIGLRSVFPTAHPQRNNLEGHCSFTVSSTGAVTCFPDGEAGEIR
jgi:beta-lactamase superfamily II metal-dependent hydrolase